MRPLDDTEFSHRAAELALEFNRYLIEHPEVEADMPESARVVLLVDGEPEYNEWAERLAKHHADNNDRPLVYYKIKRLRPIRSRIEQLEPVTS